MPSITTWNRLEPRPRTSSIDQSLSARVRDSLWMLTRQWQLGEFRGADAGSPSFVQISSQQSTMSSWRKPGQPGEPLATGSPIERVTEAEPVGPNQALRVELGQILEALLQQAGAPQLILDFRTAYPLTLPPEADLAQAIDRETARFIRVCGGRAIDGVAVYLAAQQAAPGLPASPGIADPSARAAALSALTTMRDWVKRVFGDIAVGDPAAWQPEHLEYDVEVVGTSPDGRDAVLSADPGETGGYDWYSFDRTDSAASPSAPGGVSAKPRSAFPAHIRFRGMPSARWWDFEHSRTDFGGIQPDKRDLGKLILMDFMLLHGNDWFAVPYDQPLNSLCRIETLTVRDVFGKLTLIERADALPAAGHVWTMFSTSWSTGKNGIADFFVVPPSVGVAMQVGPAVEEVRFFRDETADMVWAVEQTIENGLGQPWPGHERDLAVRGQPVATGDSAPGTASSAGRPLLKYRIQSDVPTNWIPFLPVAVDPTRGVVALERAAMLSSSGSVMIEPVGRLLSPVGVNTQPYRLRDEEVPRSGIRLTRVWYRSRWVDGSTHLWMGRRKAPGAGEGHSGLQFDLAAPG